VAPTDKVWVEEANHQMISGDYSILQSTDSLELLPATLKSIKQVTFLHT